MLPVTPPALAAAKPPRKQSTNFGQGDSSGTSFQDFLQASVNGALRLKVSSHARTRLQERGISLSQADWNRVETAVERASQKGSKDTYLMMGDVGLVVNVPNRTIITAMDHTSQTIVTNIDSVVVV
ncbi:hypothetical protein JZ785_08155 [Alicyclobacillus curvatus]|nr:hypothetical protein JZ785_08155 [Alicyclobacillus curvatus]